MARIVNILLTSFPGLGLPSTLSLPVDASIPIIDLRDQLSGHLPQVESRLILTTTSNKEIPCSQAPVSTLLSREDDTFLPLRLSVPLCGGKGGFGSQLRAAGGRMSSRKKKDQGDTNSSNRNLDGRRLRTVAEAKSLAEYKAMKPVMEKKEKEARRKRLEQIVEFTERRQDEIRNGSKGKIDGQWDEDRREAGERARDAVLAAMKSGSYHDNLKVSSSETSDDSPEIGEESEDTSMDEPETTSTNPAVKGKGALVSRKTFLGFDEDDEFMSDDSDADDGAGDQDAEVKASWSGASFDGNRILTKHKGFGLCPGEDRRQLHVESSSAARLAEPTRSQLHGLPGACPGCGAFTQHVSPNEPGYYGTNRKSVKTFIAGQELERGSGTESLTFDSVLNSADKSILSQLGLEGAARGEADKNEASGPSKDPITPVCNRCHDLTHHHAGASVIHPTVESIQKIISESPYKYNHIYHVLDAADFPLSLIPSLQQHLSLAPQRSQNRRAKTSHYKHGRKAELSFIITRSDLLAPTKEQVDKLMPYLVELLRTALGDSEKNFRLGNVRCVSSRRYWWTKEVKEEIWNRGGGGWLVGKVNVGKSNLLENVYPKGRNKETDFGTLRKSAQQGQRQDRTQDSQSQSPDDKLASQELLAEERIHPLRDSLLPPSPPETQYPVLPLVSSLPGTTAAPIRIPFGGGKGELIDLPGLSRGALEDFVLDNRKADLVMRHRVTPKQFVILPGQSLLIGGIVRIASKTPDVTLLAYPFVPLKSHVTNNWKAIGIQNQQYNSNVDSLAKPGVGSRMKGAGIYSLKWDVTEQRASPLIRRALTDPSSEILPFEILSADVLIEGCGWIEIVTQVRKRDMEVERRPGDLFDDRPYPRIGVWSPDGKYIGIRQPMGAWVRGGFMARSLKKKPARPRRSKRGEKKRLKRAFHNVYGAFDPVKS
ncbi:hypothetical protein ACLMJK_005378 [Lecanora helva]